MKTITTQNGNTFEFERINNDKNGCPRYWVSFHTLGLKSNNSTHLTKSLGLRVYNKKQRPGGYTFQSYNIYHTAKELETAGLFNPLTKPSNDN